MYNTDLVCMIKTYKEETGLSYPKIAERIGISKTTLEDIVYGIRNGKESTRQKIYNYLIKNTYREKILDKYKDKTVVGIHKAIHDILGLMYIVEIIEDENIVYEVLLEREVNNYNKEK